MGFQKGEACDVECIIVQFSMYSVNEVFFYDAKLFFVRSVKYVSYFNLRKIANGRSLDG